MKPGTLYGVGVGPGDPELITLKAVKVLNQVEVIFAASSSKNEYSLALENAKSHMYNGAEVLRLDFPMTRDKQVLRKTWEVNARQILAHLRQGKDVAFITIGDPLTYSTFGYMMQTITDMAPEIPIRIVPGVTSYQAATAAAREVMAEREQTFCVISGSEGGERLKEVISRVDCVIMLKVYRQLDRILDTLQELGIKDRITLVSRCGMKDQVISKNPEELRGKEVPYLSLLIVKKQ
ncbi:MAG: precorrin-2 C(20)-methyltransferase [Deltaproteobacteria bacterium]|nr:MAG: precorrin-2 C(20)-methyltransferase [Deltaproteobacteria bacterium]